jgi:hypothetical protein
VHASSALFRDQTISNLFFNTKDCLRNDKSTCWGEGAHACCTMLDSAPCAGPCVDDLQTTNEPATTMCWLTCAHLWYYMYVMSPACAHHAAHSCAHGHGHGSSHSHSFIHSHCGSPDHCSSILLFSAGSKWYDVTHNGIDAMMQRLFQEVGTFSKLPPVNQTVDTPRCAGLAQYPFVSPGVSGPQSASC